MKATAVVKWMFIFSIIYMKMCDNQRVKCKIHLEQNSVAISETNFLVNQEIPASIYTLFFKAAFSLSQPCA